MSKPIHRLMLWVGIIAFIIGSWSLVTGSSLRLSTDIMALLPTAEQDDAAAVAASEVSRGFSSLVALAVSSPDRDTARAAALMLEQKLTETGHFRRLMGRMDSGLWSDITAFYFPWRYMLLDEKDRQLSPERLGAKMTGNALSQLSDPMGLVNSRQLIADPLFQLQTFFLSLAGQQGNLGLDDGMLAGYYEGQYHVLVSGLLKKSALSVREQEPVVKSLDDAISRISAVYPQASVLASGMIYYMKAGTDSARQEVSTIGIGSTLGIILLLLLVFRTVTPLLLCLLSIGVGVLCGYLVTAIFFQQVHVITLVFGASLIGVSIDYAFHYLAEWRYQEKNWSPATGIRHIMPGLSLGLITSIFGYMPMLATPFPGLQQIAVFSSAGLIFSWLTVVLVYPVFLTRVSTGRGHQGWMLVLVDHLLIFWQKHLSARRRTILMAVLMLCGLGSLWLQSDDDIRQLQNRPEKLIANDDRLADITGNLGDNRFYLVRGDNRQQLLERVEQLSKTLDEQVIRRGLQGYQSITALIPSIKTQQKNYALTEAIFTEALPGLWDQLGVADASKAESMALFRKADTHWLTPEQWLNGPAAQLFGHLWLGRSGDQYFSAVMLQGVQKGWNPFDLEALEGVEFIDKTGATSELFARYRVLMGWLLLASYGVITLVLSLRYGLVGAVKVVMPPMVAGILTLSMLALTGQAINLFNILALIMVLGIGVDYTLFFREAGQASRYTCVAITLSAMTTLLSFGLLSLSDTAAISSFGVTVLAGITCCYLLSPFAMNSKKEVKYVDNK